MADLICADELGKALRVSPDTIRRWVKTGRIPAIHVNSKIIRFDPVAVRAALQRDSDARGVPNEK